MNQKDFSKDLVNALKSVVFDCNWQNVGKASTFKQMKCYRLYSLDDVDEDVLLVKDKNDNFHAIEAQCSHEGSHNRLNLSFIFYIFIS
jgi:nitrite reductase/ring-hydroxylating ferredoxin subunit